MLTKTDASDYDWPLNSVPSQFRVSPVQRMFMHSGNLTLFTGVKKAEAPKVWRPQGRLRENTGTVYIKTL